jgi:segregation and condensation protein B
MSENNNVNTVRNTISSNTENKISNEVKSVIEALLFSSGQPISIEKIKDVLDNMDLNEVRRVVQELRSEYDKDGRGIRLIEIAGGFQMITPAEFAPFLKKFYNVRKVEHLSKPALETLAIIAYKQPVSKMEIESLRSVNIDGVVANLLDKDLIRISGRKQAPGRPFVYGTTKKFLEYFGLKSIEELPKIENFQNALSQKEKTDEIGISAQTS